MDRYTQLDEALLSNDTAQHVILKHMSLHTKRDNRCVSARGLSDVAHLLPELQAAGVTFVAADNSVDMIQKCVKVTRMWSHKRGVCDEQALAMRLAAVREQLVDILTCSFETSVSQKGQSSSQIPQGPRQQGLFCWSPLF